MRISFTRYGAREMAAGTALAAALLGVCIWLWAPGAALVVPAWIAYVAFFRDPARHPPADPRAVVSPADGVVADIETVAPPGEFLNGTAVRIGVFMSILNVHVNRAPYEGEVRMVEHFPGRFLDARKPEAARVNEHNLLGLELPDGRRMLINQVAGLVARRIVCGVSAGDHLGRAERFGMVKFGSRLEVFLPVAYKAEVAIKPGQKVRAGETTLAYLPAATSP